MVKYYKHNRLIKLLVIPGALAGLMYCLFQISRTTQINSWSEIFGFGRFVRNLLGTLISAVILWTALKPDDPLPYHWLLLLPFSILLTIFSWIGAGIITIIGSVVALIDAI